jgi:hypothetical protein
MVFLGVDNRTRRLEMGVDNQVVTHLVLAVSSSDESFNGDCDLALVCLSEEMIDTLVARLNEVEALKRCDTQTRWGSMYAVEFWDYDCRFFRDTNQVDEMGDAGQEDVRVLLGQGDPVRLLEAPTIEEGEFQAVDCITVMVSPTEVWWTGIVKHTNCHVDTAIVPAKVIRDIQRRFKEAKRGLPTEESHESLAVGALRDLVEQLEDSTEQDDWTCSPRGLDLTRAKAVLSGV